MRKPNGGRHETSVYISGMFEQHTRVQGITYQNNCMHIMDDEKRIALLRIGSPLDANDSSPAVQYHLGDHLESSHLVVSANGTWTNREEFSPYGETSLGSFSKKRYRFTGQEKDEETGLSYHKARYFMPWVGRWTSNDLENQYIWDNPNRYQYTKNNPLTLTDPDGLQELPTIRLSFHASLSEGSHIRAFEQALARLEFQRTLNSIVTLNQYGLYLPTNLHEHTRHLPPGHPTFRYPSHMPLFNFPGKPPPSIRIRQLPPVLPPGDPVEQPLAGSKGAGIGGSVGLVSESVEWHRKHMSAEIEKRGQYPAHLVQAAKRSISLTMSKGVEWKGYVVFRLPRGVWPSQVVPIDLLRTGTFVGLASEKEAAKYRKESGRGDIHYIVSPTRITGSLTRESQPLPATSRHPPTIGQAR